MPGKMYASDDDFSTVIFDRRWETPWERARTRLTRYVPRCFGVWLAVGVESVEPARNLNSRPASEAEGSRKLRSRNTRFSNSRSEQSVLNGRDFGREFLSKAPCWRDSPQRIEGDSISSVDPRNREPTLRLPSTRPGLPCSISDGTVRSCPTDFAAVKCDSDASVNLANSIRLSLAYPWNAGDELVI